jgi:hypothetical protein
LFNYKKKIKRSKKKMIKPKNIYKRRHKHVKRKLRGGGLNPKLKKALLIATASGIAGGLAAYGVHKYKQQVQNNKGLIISPSAPQLSLNTLPPPVVQFREPQTPSVPQLQISEPQTPSIPQLQISEPQTPSIPQLQFSVPQTTSVPQLQSSTPQQQIEPFREPELPATLELKLQEISTDVRPRYHLESSSEPGFSTANPLSTFEIKPSTFVPALALGVGGWKGVGLGLLAASAGVHNNNNSTFYGNRLEGTNYQYLT